MTTLFKPNFTHYEGVRPIQIYIMRLFFGLMFFMVSFPMLNDLIRHTGPWDTHQSIMITVWSAYTLMSFWGIYNTLKMLPIMFFMMFYKAMWLYFVALPLWQEGTLQQSPHAAVAYNFIWLIIPALFFPYTYFFKQYILPKSLYQRYFGFKNNMPKAVR